jgi:hypothetical protein
MCDAVYYTTRLQHVSAEIKITVKFLDMLINSSLRMMHCLTKRALFEKHPMTGFPSTGWGE